MRRLRQKETSKNESTGAMLPVELYKEIALHADIDTLKVLSMTYNHFYNLYHDDQFWKDKIALDFPFAMDPNREYPYTVDSYGSILNAWEMANELINHDMILTLNNEWPWYISLDKITEDDVPENIKIFNHHNHYIVFYKYLHYTDDDQSEAHIKVKMTKNQVLKLLTNLLYHDDIRCYKAI